MAERWKPDESFKREERVDVITSDADKRTVELSFSSEMPVKRYDWSKDKEYMEVLSHDPADVDLSRLNNAHPLLLNHDTEDQIGVVESAAIADDRKGRATVRFSKSQRGTEIWRDVVDGIRRLVSVGYRRVKEVASEEKDGLETVRFAWQPYEISIVPVPADGSVGIGRSEKTEPEKPKSEITIMSETTTDPVADERKRVADIQAAADTFSKRIPGIAELAKKAILEGHNLDQFRADAMAKIPEPQVSKPGIVTLGVSDRDLSKYSLTRAICAAAEHKPLDGLERELSDEISMRTGQKPKNSFWYPYEAMGYRALQGQGVATASLGGNIKATEIWADEYILALRNRMLIGRLGARMLTGLQSDIAIPRTYHNTAAYWVTEVEAATISDVGIQQLSLTPKCVTAKTAYSKKLLIQGVPSIDQLLRDDMVTTLALAIDKAALHGAGASGEPTGIYSGAAAANLVTLSTNGANFNTLGLTARAALVSLESVIGTSNADVAGIAFVTNAKVRGSLRNAVNNTNADTFIWSNSGQVGVGEVIGYPAYVTNQVLSDRTVGSHTTASSIFFGNWQDLIMATWGAGLDVLVDNLTSAGAREILIYADQYCDVGLRHTESFSVLLGIEAG